MSFELSDTFKKKTFITDLELSAVVLEGKEIPWILLIPRVENASNLTDLSFDNQVTLLKEINLCSTVMKDLFNSDRLNIATIGNKTPQLHIHIISRRKDDVVWPQSAWDKEINFISSEEKLKRAERIREALRKELYIGSL